MNNINYFKLLKVAIEEAEQGLAEGGIPIGAALFNDRGELLARGHNRRVQDGDPSGHAEINAFRRAGRQTTYDDKILVTTLAPCWYCSGLVRQFGIRSVLIGDAKTFSGGMDWLRANGTSVLVVQSDVCVRLIQQFVLSKPHIWNEDIGVSHSAA